MRLYIYILNILFFIIITPSNSQCNGYESLCFKKYDEVAYLTTHNAYSSNEDGFYLPNQNFNITSQLTDGVRAFMLDVYSENDQLVLYHGVSELGSSLFLDVLNEFKTFIDDNPNEVITLILEDYSSIIQLSDALFTSGIIAASNCTSPSWIICGYFLVNHAKSLGTPIFTSINIQYNKVCSYILNIQF